MRRRAAMTLAMLIAAPVSTLALPWDKDMVDQPSVKPQETEVTEPEGSVPADAAETLARPADASQLVLQRVQAGATLSNPQAADEPSLARGKAVYETHCSVCHGVSGKGDGPVGQKYTPPPIDLTIPYVQRQADGQIYYTITRGSVVMPVYHDAILPADRWHLVNYVLNGLVSQ